MLGSVVHLTLDEGYGELTDPQIAQFAGISTEAFHKQFANKEECFLTVVDEFASEALQAVEAAIAPISRWSEAVPVAVSSFIEHIVSHPALLRMAFVDLFDVGPGMIGRMTKSIDRFTGMIDERGPEPRRAPEVAPEAITGAVWDIISAYSSAERMRYLPCLSDHIAFVVLAPYTGPKAAIDTIEQARNGSARLRRSQVAAARLAAPPLAQPDAIAADAPVPSGAKTVIKLSAKTPAKSAAAKAKPAGRTAAKRSSKATAGTARAARTAKTAGTAKAAKAAGTAKAAGKAKTTGKATDKPAATKASRTSAKATAKPAAAKKAAEPDRLPAKRPASRPAASRGGASRSRPRPPQ